MKDLPIDKQDGCLNYVITQLLRKTSNLITTTSKIDFIIYRMFLVDESYFNYERVRGLLSCIIDEYNRREWKDYKKVTELLRHLIELNKTRLEIYEDKKIDENGDLE